jgi:hypothetical protein
MVTYDCSSKIVTSLSKRTGKSSSAAANKTRPGDVARPARADFVKWAMAVRVDRRDVRPRYARRGRSFVYILPCRDRDLLKIGFSREPLERFQTLHPRYFEFFDLERGLLVETDRVSDARRIEREFITTYADQRAGAPSEVPRSAAGHTEWFSGIHPTAVEKAHELCSATGFSLHSPLRDWLRSELATRTDLLFDWSDRLLEAIEYERFNAGATPDRSAVERMLHDVLDAFVALDISIQTAVPERVFRWHQNNGRFRTEVGREPAGA